MLYCCMLPVALKPQPLTVKTMEKYYLRNCQIRDVETVCYLSTFKRDTQIGINTHKLQNVNSIINKKKNKLKVAQSYNLTDKVQKYLQNRMML